MKFIDIFPGKKIICPFVIDDAHEKNPWKPNSYRLKSLEGRFKLREKGEGMKQIMIEVDGGKHARDAKRERLG